MGMAFAAVALLFNPVMPARMARSDWQVVNILFARSFSRLVGLLEDGLDCAAFGPGIFHYSDSLGGKTGRCQGTKQPWLLYDSGKVYHKITHNRRRGFAKQRIKGIQMHSSTLPLFTGMARVFRKTFPYLRFWYQKAAEQENLKLKLGWGASTLTGEV